ncbi:MAG: radical SAM protein [Oscillospiraceae bacterium]|nr:radical SAM protein [Oscillospiraceae bacterium]
MANIIITEPLSAEEKIDLMREDSLYDVADDDIGFGPELAGIKNEIKAKPGPPKVPKVFISNNCVFNCAYCCCRAGREDKRRYENTPMEMAEASVNMAKASGHGVFISSAICRNADYTEELIIETLKHIRTDFGYNGYLHAKIMPGADPELIRRAGLYASRLSINIEVANSEGYKKIARNKTRENILTPMGQIHQFIKSAKDDRSRFQYAPRFATSQTTQLMAGSTGESDYDILRLSKALYQKYDLSRVYYPSFQYQHQAEGYDLPLVSTPGWRMKRLYQADRLMQIYGFAPEEIAPDSEPNLTSDIDPKAAWALRHIHLYPVEANTADYETLLRVPGIGTVYAQRIIKARKYCKITHDVLTALGVSLKRSRHFITCCGKFEGEKSGDLDVLRGLVATPLEDDLQENVDLVYSDKIEDDL